MSGPLSLGRVTAALATVYNENSASLATANIDFTLINVTAPVEFNALGATISRKRKVDVEEGALPQNGAAISIWVEIVQKQKEYIRGKGGNVLYSHKHQAALSAAQQDISRSDLANWDASARTWLQSSDQAKTLQHMQTMLILNNASVPVNNEPET
jgi:hypothetical protein